MECSDSSELLDESAYGSAVTDRRIAWFPAESSFAVRCVFINGESFQAAGRDATLMRGLADRRQLSARELAALSPPARELLDDWVAAGWVLHGGVAAK